MCDLGCASGECVECGTREVLTHPCSRPGRGRRSRGREVPGKVALLLLEAGGLQGLSRTEAGLRAARLEGPGCGDRAGWARRSLGSGHGQGKELGHGVGGGALT